MRKPDPRPYRSVLYIPGSKPRAIDKARALAADALILDLEDAVAPGEKAAARATVAEELERGGFRGRGVMVRINALSTEWGEADLEALLPAAPEAILLPKVDSASDITALFARIEEAGAATRIWAMMETPLSILNAAEIAAAPRMMGMVMGTNDLAKDLGCTPGPDRAPLQAALSMCLLAARANRLVCVDGVYNAFTDTEGLARECAQGRAFGFDGKTVIHPAQVETANAVFSPGAQELDLARRQIAAHAEAIAAGQGVAVLDGRIVENLHVAAARHLIARAEAIDRSAPAS